MKHVLFQHACVRTTARGVKDYILGFNLLFDALCCVPEPPNCFLFLLQPGIGKQLAWTALRVPFDAGTE